MLKRIILLIVILGGIICLSGESFARFRERLGAENSWAKAEGMIKDYLAQTGKVEEMRALQDIWMNRSPDSCVAWFAKARTQNPDSPAYEYLCLRLEEDEGNQLQGAYQLCQKHPDFYWGYRLLLLTLMPAMLDEERDGLNPLEDKDYLLEVVDAGHKKFPQDDYFNIFQFHRYRIQNNDPKAEAALAAVKDPNVLQANWNKIMFSLISSPNKALYAKVMPGLISNAIKSGELSPADSLLRYSGGYVSILEASQAWQDILDYLANNPVLLENGAYCCAWVDALAAVQRWEQLSRDLLKFALDKKLDPESLDFRLKKWTSELQGFSEWAQLTELAQKS